MKRSGPIVRRTPLVRGGRLRAVSPRRARQNRARAAAEAALGRVGTQGVCARCGRHGYVNGHEKLARSQGGDPTKPDCLLCVPCNTWCEDNPRAAAEQGWKYSRKWSAA